MAVSVRHAQPRDAEAIAAVHVAAWQAAYRGLMPDGFLDGITVESWSARWKERFADNQLPAVFVAVRERVVVGFCIVATPNRDEDAGEDVAEVVALNVLPDQWRTGVGTALMAEALEGFRRDGWQMASLWVLEGNQRALEFYRRLGFVRDGSTKVHGPSGATEVRLRRGVATPP